MKSTKTFKVVMLPNENKGARKGELCICPMGLCKSNIDTFHSVQHLYIISDEPINEGNWCIGESKLGKIIFKAEIVDQNIFNKEYGYFGKFQTKKIVATTDFNLTTIENILDSNGEGKGEISSPQLPESFIKAFIISYNEGKPITEVNLEMVFDYDNQNKTYEPPPLIIKTREDNTVIIHKSKVITEDEMYLNMQYYMEYCERNGYVTPMAWIENHKHF